MLEVIVLSPCPGGGSATSSGEHDWIIQRFSTAPASSGQVPHVSQKCMRCGLAIEVYDEGGGKT